MIARLAGDARVHVAVAFVLMGGWALYANRAHPFPEPLLAALVQGAMSGAITFALKRALDGLRARLPHHRGWWAPPMLALGCSLCLLITVHWLTGTPEIMRTISVPFSVATLYAVTYNLIRWKKEAA